MNTVFLKYYMKHFYENLSQRQSEKTEIQYITIKMLFENGRERIEDAQCKLINLDKSPGLKHGDNRIKVREK